MFYLLLFLLSYQTLIFWKHNEQNKAANYSATNYIHLFLFVCFPGGNYRGVFALGLVQGEWKMYVKGPLDREERNLYIINVTASDGLFVSQTMVEVTVMDTNDNSPICDQVRNKGPSGPHTTLTVNGSVMWC